MDVVQDLLHWLLGYLQIVFEERGRCGVWVVCEGGEYGVSRACIDVE